MTNYITTKKQLAYGATVTWSFAFPDNCPLFNSIQGAGATRNYVQQVNINGENLDVNMVCDATAGKMDNCRRMTNDLTQVNNGTKFTIPAVNGMTVKVNANGKMSATEIAGSTSYTGTGTTSITYKYTGSEETIDIDIKDGSYLSSIVVTYPKTAEDPTKPSEIFSATATKAYSVPANTVNGSLSGYATVTGGSMTVNNGQGSAKDLVKSQASTIGFCATNGNTYFTATLDNALQVGDVISMKMYGGVKEGNNIGVVVKPEYASQDQAILTSDGETAWKTYNYTIKPGDDIVGATTVVFCRTAGASTYFTNITVSRPATMATPSINAQGYGTFSCEYDVQITGAKAYKAKLEGTTITCTEIPNGLVPAGEGVLLFKSGTTEATTATALYAASASAVTENDLKATTLADGSLAAPESSLVLSGNTFMSYTGGAFAAGKAYFPYAGSAKSFRIVFAENGQTTGINTVSAQKVANAKFIENGRIVIVKDGAKYNVAGQVIK